MAMSARQTAAQLSVLALLALLAVGCARATAAVPPSASVTPAPAIATAPPAPASATAPPAPTPTLVPAPAIAPSVAPTITAPAEPAPSFLPPTPTALASETRQQIFNEVWSTINENYLYPDFQGVDWQAVRDEFESRAIAAPTDAGFYEQLGLMVNRLGDDHSRFLPPQAAQRQDALTSGREEQVGIGVITLALSDSLLIQHVFPDSPAARAGLRPRDRIVTIDGFFYAQRDIQGPEGTPVRLTVVRPGEESRDIVIVRRRVEGLISPAARRLPGDVGYLSITTLWVSDMDQQVARALASIAGPTPLTGLIIDLRSNPGGWRSVLTGLLSHFVQDEVGSFTSRKGDAPLVIDAGAGPDLRGIPLVVLIDRSTASYAELIAAVLQRQAGAVVVGAPSAGNTETIYSYELTGGARLWVAQEGFRLNDGTVLEGLGVQPDIALLEDWTRFSEEDDPGINLALQLLTRGTAGK
jgi:C-terminal peptidase prc